MKTKNADTENLVFDAIIIILKRPINMDVKNYSGVFQGFSEIIFDAMGNKLTLLVSFLPKSSI